MKPDQARTIELSADVETIVRSAVDSGEYATVGEAIDAAVRAWNDTRERTPYTLKELRDLVREGYESGPSRFGTMDELKTEARRRLAERDPH